MAVLKKTQAVKKPSKHLLGIQDLSIPVINRILDSSLDFVELNRKSEKKLKLLMKNTYDIELRMKNNSSINMQILIKKLLVDLCELANAS